MLYQKLDKRVLDNGVGGAGVEIRVDGFKGRPEGTDEAQIFLEIYGGKLRIIVWNGQYDPKIIEIDPIEGGPNEDGN